MKRFFTDLIKYARYTKYAVKAGLKSEVANSHLSWLWWLLDPILFMLVYTFIAQVVFTHNERYFPVFVFVGLTIWNFFSKTMNGSVKLVRKHKSVLTRVYLPKWVLSIEKMGNLFFKMCISFALILILMIIFQVPFSFRLFHMIPVLIVLIIVSFGFSTLLMHFGVFMDDLSNIVEIFMKLVFYLSGVFYNLYTRVPEPFNKILLRGNPAAFLIEQSRKIIIYQQCPDYLWLSIWFGIGLLLCIIGVATVYRYENSYAKVI